MFFKINHAHGVVLRPPLRQLKKAAIIFSCIAFLSFCIELKNNNLYAKNYYISSCLQKELAVNVNEALAKNPISTDDYLIFSHGKPGAIWVDNQWLSGKGLVNWLQQQSDGKNIRLFACEFGKGVIGQKAVTYLQKELGVCISASNNITGKDGDWVLEVGEKYNAISINSYQGNLQWTFADTCATCDYDGDLVTNINDMDDDNDGILDVIESSSCFYTATEAATIAKISSPIANSNGINIDLPHMYDDTTISTTNNNTITSGHTLPAVLYVVEFPIPVKLTNLIFYGSSWGTTSKGVLEGSNDQTTWTKLSDSVVTNGTTARTFTNTFNAANTYKYYRLVKTVGTTTANIITYELTPTLDMTGYAQYLHPKSTCLADIDGDGKPNHQDRDADGDGCYDIYESSVPGYTSSSTSTSGVVGANGYSDALETTAESGTPNFTSTYSLYAIYNARNFCADTDGDNIKDLNDIDDDNDGVVDAIENPTCYYSVYEARIPTNVTTNFPWTTAEPLTLAYNTDVTDYAQLGAQTTAAGLALVEFAPTIINNTLVSNVQIETGTAISNTVTSYFRLEGWNGSSWDSLSARTYLGANTVITLSNTYHPSVLYSKYRIAGVTGASNTSGRLKEFWVNFANYNASLQPKPNCSGSGSDLDNDGIVNPKDLDSDGDGVSDSYEAGAITTEVANHQYANPITDANSDGLVDSVDPDLNGITNYSYLPYGYIKDIFATLDLDGDTIKDIVDTDDDNDGILDCAEAGSTGAGTKMEVRNVNTTTHTADFTNSLGDVLFSLTATSDASTGITAFGQGTPSDNTIWQEGDFNGAATTKHFWFQFSITQKVGGLVSFETISANSTFGIVNSHDAGSFTWDFDPDLLTATLVSISSGTLSLNGTTIAVGGEIQPWSVYDKDPAATVVVAFKSKVYTPAGTVFDIRSYYVNGGFPRYEDYGIRSLYVYCPFIDKDKDGLPNNIDLDSDGDGCPDALEGGANYASNTLVASSMSGGNSGASYTGTAGPNIYNLGATADANGVPTVSGSPQTVNNSQTYAATFTAGTPCATFIAAATPLFLGLTSFSAFPENFDAKLNWGIVTANNSTYLMNIERSFNGSNFTTIASINGSGNAGLESSYQYDDKEVGLKDTIAYYRLKVVNSSDGSIYSATKPVHFSKTNSGLYCYPNPAQHYLRFNKLITNATIQLYNVRGELVLNKAMKETDLDISQLVDGIYIIRIVENNGAELYKQVWMKQNH